MSGTPSTVAGIDIAPNANLWPGPNGSRTARPNFLRSLIFMWSSPCQRRSPRSLYQNKEVVYGILFRTTAETLKTIAADPKHLGAEIGFFAVLHSWGQNLQFHPAPALRRARRRTSPDGQRWVSCRPGFFLPVRVLSCLFRRLFLESLAEGIRCRQTTVLRRLGTASGSGRAFARLSGQTEKLQVGGLCQASIRRTSSKCSITWAAIPTAWPSPITACSISKTIRSASSGRIIAAGDQIKTMTLSAEEFIRRFLLHVLPNGFQRIRYYGFLGNRYREEKLADVAACSACRRSEKTTPNR